MYIFEQQMYLKTNFLLHQQYNIQSITGNAGSISGHILQGILRFQLASAPNWHPAGLDRRVPQSPDIPYQQLLSVGSGGVEPFVILHNVYNSEDNRLNPIAELRLTSEQKESPALR